MNSNLVEISTLKLKFQKLKFKDFKIYKYIVINNGFYM